MQSRPETTEDLGPVSGQYLVRTTFGAIVLHGSETPASRVLVPRVRGALYDAALELLWFIDGDRLGAVDLRTRERSPITIASHVPPAVSRLSIAHPSGLTETEDGCDLDQLSVEWSPALKVDVGDPDASPVRIENRTWLEAQRARVPRATGKRREFAGKRVRLPTAVMQCEEPESCGAALPLGSLQLVMTLEKMGGDCMQRGCLLFDATTARFAQPPVATVWHAAADAQIGTCGLFRFDHTGANFLVEDKLCALGGACRVLEGRGLGWLDAGDVVGAAGLH